MVLYQSGFHAKDYDSNFEKHILKKGDRFKMLEEDEDEVGVGGLKPTFELQIETWWLCMPFIDTLDGFYVNVVHGMGIPQNHNWPTNSKQSGAGNWVV